MRALVNDIGRVCQTYGPEIYCATESLAAVVSRFDNDEYVSAHVQGGANGRLI